MHKRCIDTDAITKGAATNISNNLGSNLPFNNIVAPDASNTGDAIPKAYLTVLFFNERFEFVEEGSSFKRVIQPCNGTAPLVLANIKAPKNGYAYVYLSNESDETVYFDNLQVAHNRGRIVEENHYYAYGLKISAISSKKLGDNNEGYLKNLYQFQGAYNEFDEDLGWNGFALRDYDPQIGRWAQQDPYQEFPSPYTGMGNEPINNTDPSGGSLEMMPRFVFGAASTAMKGAGVAASAVNIAGKAVSVISNIISVTSLVIKTANAVTTIINTNITTKQVGDGKSNPNYWILYSGTNVNIYNGEYGNVGKSTLVESLAGTSGGLRYQNSSMQNVSQKGPVPEGDYSVDLSISPRNRKVSYADDGQTNQDVGIQQMTDKSGTGFNSEWVVGVQD